MSAPCLTSPHPSIEAAALAEVEPQWDLESIAATGSIYGSMSALVAIRDRLMLDLTSSTS